MNMDDQWHLRASVLTMMLAIPSIAYGCGRTEFYELSGSISSVNYPYQYPNNINCTYSIISPGLHQSVFIGFTDLDTEAGLDPVEIWCSTSVSSKRTFSGRNTNVSFFPLQPCTYVIVNFRTDGSVVGRGFNLIFNWLHSVCGKTEFHDLSGFISSPGYPNPYTSGTICTYSIRSPGIRESLFIGFTDIDTEPCCDTVEIWCSANASTKRTFSGQHTNNYSSLTLQSCNEIKVNFQTDGSVVGRGFKLLFSWFDSGCGRTEFSELGGVITSPNYPRQYYPDINCTYSIRSPGLHQTASVGFTDLATQAGRDTVQIWCSTNSTGIMSFSGRIASLSFLELQSCKDVKVKFRTDHSIQERGFKLLFYWTLSSRQTTISSPTTEPTSMSSIQTETEVLHDTPFAILAVLGAKTLSSLVVVLASLLCAFVFIIILLSIIYAIRRVKRRKNATKPRLDVRSAVNPRGCSNDGYSLEPISTCQRPLSVKSDLEEPDYELMDSPNHNDEDVYENVECIVR